MYKKRRILAVPPQRASSNLSFLLLGQQLGWHNSEHLRRKYAEISLKSLKLQTVYDAYDEQSTQSMVLPYMQRRSAVLEVVTHGSLLFVLVNSGLCTVFKTDLTKPRRLGYLNEGHHDVVRTILFNACDASILAVSFHSTDPSFPSKLHCRSVPARPSSFDASATSCLYCTAGHPICEAVTSPGFVEFDEAAHRALLLNATTMQYKLYDLSSPSYSLLYCFSAQGINEVTMSSRYLLIVRAQRPKGQQQQLYDLDGSHHPQQQQHQQLHPQEKHRQQVTQRLDDEAGCAATSVLPLEVLSVVNGMLLCRHELPAASSFKDFDVLELFDDMLLAKQPLQPFKIYNVLSLALQGSSSHEFLSQVSTFLYLQQQRLFMTICHHTPTVWDFRAQVVAVFDDHDLWYPDHRDYPLVYVTQDWLASYCRPKGLQALLPAGAAASIHISSLVTGKLLAKIGAPPTTDEDTCDVQQRLVAQQPQGGTRESTAVLDARQALTDVTALVFDERRHVIYTGTHAGVVHMWAPG